MPNHNGVNEAIRVLMWRRDLSQTDLGAAIGLSRSAVNDRLRGRVDWRLKELEDVATSLNVSIHEIVKEVTAE